LNALEKNEFFQRFIHDPAERQEFLTRAAPYVKYKFYPKGTSVVELQQAVSSLSIIIKGKALYYTFKEPDEIRKEGSAHVKGQVMNVYTRFMQDEHLEERFKKWLSKHELGTKALRKRMSSISTTEEEGSERESISPDDDDFRSVIEKVLQEHNTILPPHLRESDLSFEEKLVLLSKFGVPGDHVKNSYIALKARRELVPGETFGEETLVKPQLANFMIIATEDTHIVSFLRYDLKLLFASDIKNLHKKIEYLRKVFPEVPRMYIMEMAYYLEERVLFNSELVYKEGEEADALYLIKSGEIEISMIKESQLNEEYFSNDHLPVKSRPKFNEKHRLMLGKLLAGSIFGEDEILKKMNKRIYSAKACQPHTFVYVIKKNIFNQIFETYFPEVIETLKDWMELKYKWREQRIKKEQKIADLISEDNEASLEREFIDGKLIKKYSQKNKKLVFENGSGMEQLLQGENTEIPVHAAFRVTNNPSPNVNSNPFNSFGLSSNIYFSKELKKTNQERSPKPLEQNNQTRIAFKLNSIREKSQSQNKETIEKQKTKLFVENQTKLNKFKKPLSYSRLSSKNLVSPRKQSEQTLKTEAAPHILNFEKIKDIQQSEIHHPSGEKPQEHSHLKTSILPQVSPRFFLVRSYRPSNGSLNSLDVEPFNRRNSSILNTEQENIAPFTMKNLEVRRGTTMPSSLKDDKLEERKYDDFGLKNISRVSKQKKSGDFMIRSLASLQHSDKNSHNAKSQISSKTGSLAYLDAKNEEITLNNSSSIKNTYSSLKEINIGRKMLSPRGAELIRVSPRIGFSNFRFRVQGTSIDKSETRE